MRQTNTTPLRSQPSRHQPTPQPKRNPIKLWMVAVAFVVLALGSRINHPHKSAAAVVPKPTVSAVQQQANIETMNTSIQQVITNNPTVDISATIVDTSSAKTYNYGPNVAYEAASVAKLITAAELLHGTERGTIQLSTKLDDGQTAKTDLQRMVVKSDNAAWQSLNDEMTLNSLQAYAQSIGITDYNLANNSLTTKDIALLLQKLYSGHLLNKSNTNLLLGYMARANEAELIPPVVPKDAKVYHKAGLLDDRVHDAAIIDDGDHAIIVVVFTNGHGTYSFPGRTTAIQSITKSAMSAFGIQ